MLDWNDLRFALAVVRTGSLSGAARSLGVHQTTVGRRLTALEAELGFSLFLRTPGGLLPTSDGDRILASIGELAGSLTRFEQGAREDVGGPRGLVRLAVTEATARQLLEATIPALLAEHPELAIEIVPANGLTDLARGDADLAIRLVSPEDGLVARRLGFVRHGLYGADGYLRQHRGPLSPGLAGHRVLVPSRELAKGPEATWLAQHASEAARVLHGSSLPVLALGVARGLGLSVLPTNIAAMHDGLRLVRALPEIPARPVWLVMHQDQRRVQRVRVVAEAVAADLKRRLADATPTS